MLGPFLEQLYMAYEEIILWCLKRDAAVELFESEKNNREQRRKKREERNDKKDIK